MADVIEAAMNATRPVSGVDASPQTPDHGFRTERFRDSNRPCGNALFSYLMCLTGGDRERAEGLLPDALTRAHRHAEAATSEPMRGWVSPRSDRYVGVHRWRSRRSLRTVATEAAPPATTAVAASPAGEEQVAHAMISHEVRKALASLSVEHRTVIVEVQFRRRSAPEVATALGLSIDTIKTRIYYAMRAFRLALEEQSMEMTSMEVR